jgi:transcriptional regulator with XRE-family HTH domain
MEDQSVPELVKRLRERMDLTQEQFAREVGVVFSTVNQWENGQRSPQPYLLKRFLEMKVFLKQNPPIGKSRRRRP